MVSMNKKPKPDDNFVVYAYSRSEGSENGPEGSFYYIGKGRPERPYNCKSRKHIRCPRDKKNNIHILHNGLREDVAFDYEIKLIKFYGRIDTQEGWQTLRNLTDGGEGASGAIVPKGSREKTTGRNNKNYVARCWSHPVHGFVMNKSVSEIVREYESDKLFQCGLSMLATGKCFSYKKWVIVSSGEINFNLTKTELSKKYGQEYALKKLEQIKRNKSGINHHKYSPRNWYHLVHGVVLNRSCRELVKMFPGDGLSPGCLSNLAVGKSFYHSGWIFLGDKTSPTPEMVKKLSKAHDTGKDFDWYHYEHGEIRGVSVVGLAKMFPEQNLGHANLSRLQSGSEKWYKGWVTLENKDLSNDHPPRGIPRDWYHPDVGVVRGVTAKEMTRLYPEYGLTSNGLCDLANGKLRTHSGWSLPPCRPDELTLYR
jgi:hypothetical protein